MQPYGVVFNLEYRIAICTTCSVGFLAPHVVGHVQEQHRINLHQDAITPYIRGLKLVETPHDFQLPEFPRPPIQGITVQAGFACGVVGCDDVYKEYSSMKSHLSRAHPGLGTRNTHHQAFIQKVYRGRSEMVYIRVTEKQDIPGTHGEYLEAYLSQRAESPAMASLKDNPKPPWVERIGWAGRLDTLQPDLLGVLLLAAQKPTYDNPLASIGQAMYMYFTLAGTATKDVPVYVRLNLKSKNRWANAFMDQSANFNHLVQPIGQGDVRCPS